MTARRRTAMLGWLSALTLSATSVASAQTSQPVSRPPGRPIELAVGGSWIAPVGLGTVDADLLTSGGSPITQFTTSNSLGAAFGGDVHLTFALSRRVAAEALGSLTRISFETEITQDLEDADGVTLTETGLRFGAAGAMRVLLATTGATRWFLRGGAGWLRETAGGSSLVGDGLSVDAGVVMMYLWRDRPRGTLRRLGLRLDGKIAFRSGGLTLGEDTLRAGPAVGGALTMGFR